MNDSKGSLTVTSSSLLDISIFRQKSSLERAHKDIQLVYIVEGKMKVTINNNVSHLKKSDFILINSNVLHTFRSDHENLFVVCRIDYSELCKLLSVESVLFSCNSTEQNHQADNELRATVKELLNVYMNEGKIPHVEILEKTYKLLACLTSNYLINEKESVIDMKLIKSEQNGRLAEILQYLYQNYSEPLSLREVAELHYTSVPYLSKYFKKKTGMTFSECLNEIRLPYAVNELINTNKSITRIAMDNGFSNLLAFNRVFKKKYTITPADYRKQKKESKFVTELDNQNENQAFKEIKDYLDTVSQKKNSSLEKVNTELIKIKEKEREYTKNWSKLINIGYAKDILNSDMQEQIVILQKDIRFSYARFWGLFGEGMHIEDRLGDKTSYNFSNINKLIDFLIKNNLKPFIELGPKPKVISKSIKENILVQSFDHIDRTVEEWKNLMHAFMQNCLERYGIEEVETWYFEIWRIQKELHQNSMNGEKSQEYFPNENVDKQFDEYFNLFSNCKLIINKFVPLAKVGGCGLSIDLNGEILEKLLQKWKLEAVQPDFFSAYIYPIELNIDKKKLPRENPQSTNPDYIKSKLKQVRKALNSTGFSDIELNITEWNISFSNRNFLNDSCFKASYIVKNIIDNLNIFNVNILGYWLSSDIFSDFRDSKNLLHGGSGLITKNGIKKPSYHAFILLKQLGETLIYKSKNFVVTKKSGDRYQILLFNYKHFDYSYYLNPEGSTGIDEQYDHFESADPLTFSIELDGLSNGEYRVKERELNRNHGSILDEWIKFGATNDMKLDEIEFLKQICIPQMKVKHTSVEGNAILLNGELQPHEVKLIELDLLIRN